MRLWIARFYRLIGKMEIRRGFKNCWRRKMKQGSFNETGLCTSWKFSLFDDENSCEKCPYRAKEPIENSEN